MYVERSFQVETVATQGVFGMLAVLGVARRGDDVVGHVGGVAPVGDVGGRMRRRRVVRVPPWRAVVVVES